MSPPTPRLFSDVPNDEPPMEYLEVRVTEPQDIPTGTGHDALSEQREDSIVERAEETSTTTSRKRTIILGVGSGHGRISRAELVAALTTVGAQARGVEVTPLTEEEVQARGTMLTTGPRRHDQDMVAMIESMRRHELVMPAPQATWQDLVGRDAPPKGGPRPGRRAGKKRRF